MKKKDAVIKLWRECFDDSDQFVDMFFSKVYRDEDALLLEENGRPVSAMLLQRYAMNFHGITLPVSYICGAATTVDKRSHGYMGRLMKDAVVESYRRGVGLCCLIPANERLFGYYCRFGFSPVFCTCVEHFTSAHPFRHEGEYGSGYDLNSDEAYAFFDRMMRMRPCCIQHSREQFHNIIMDNSVDGGDVVTVTDGSGEPVGMAFAVPEVDEVSVKDVLAIDDDARNAVLSKVREEFSDLPITVLSYRTLSGEATPRGMARIINVEQILSTLAAANENLSLVVRVHDCIIGENNHIYIVGNGTCEVNDDYNPEALDYDINVEVLTSIVFGNEVTEKILDFPAVRPYMSLMLD